MTVTKLTAKRAMRFQYQRKIKNSKGMNEQQTRINFEPNKHSPSNHKCPTTFGLSSHFPSLPFL